MFLSDENGSVRLTPLQAMPGGASLIEMEVHTTHGPWTTHDPGIDRNDLRKIARWLREIGRGRQPKELAFMEPNLRFEHLRADGDRIAIRVWFEGEARPEWAPYQTWGEEDLWLDLSVEHADVTAAADALADELNRVEARS